MEEQDSGKDTNMLRCFVWIWAEILNTLVIYIRPNGIGLHKYELDSSIIYT